MKRFPELRPNRWDGLVLAAVVLLALAAGLAVWRGGSGEALTAVISVDGVETDAIDLSALRGGEERIISANGYTLHLAVDGGGACIRESDCPTQDCVHTGRITRPGQSIVCLPARVTVQLRGGETTQSGVDAVLG